MLLEISEAYSAELLHVAAGIAGSATRLFRRLARHGLVYGLIPVVNALSQRVYVQYRPDRYSGQDRDVRALKAMWGAGRQHNNGGDYARLYFMATSVEALEEAGVPGSFAELGVYKGSSAKLMHHLAPDRDLYLFDTFNGFPEQHARADPGRIEVGGYASGLEEVRRFVGDDPRIRYCEGTFPDTSHMVPEGVRFALVHLDCDLYVPTKAALEFFYPRLEPGGLLILHDYDSGCWPGVPRAVDEFLADKPEGLIRIPDKSGTAALVKQRDTSRPETKRTSSGTQETG